MRIEFFLASFIFLFKSIQTITMFAVFFYLFGTWTHTWIRTSYIFKRHKQFEIDRWWTSGKEKESERQNNERITKMNFAFMLVYLYILHLEFIYFYRNLEVPLCVFLQFSFFQIEVNAFCLRCKKKEMLNFTSFTPTNGRCLCVCLLKLSNEWGVIFHFQWLKIASNKVTFICRKHMNDVVE